MSNQNISLHDFKLRVRRDRALEQRRVSAKAAFDDVNGPLLVSVIKRQDIHPALGLGRAAAKGFDTSLLRHCCRGYEEKGESREHLQSNVPIPTSKAANRLTTMIAKIVSKLVRQIAPQRVRR